MLQRVVMSTFHFVIFNLHRAILSIVLNHADHLSLFAVQVFAETVDNISST